MHLSEAFPSQFLKWEDLDGKEPTVVISGAEIELLGTDRKLVLQFQGKQKRFVCNRTNANAIEFLYGSDTEDWIGKEITLFVVPVQFQGKMVNGLRVRAPGKRAAKPSRASDPRPEPTPRDDMDDEIPW
jgi:hypothetical protein